MEIQIPREPIDADEDKFKSLLLVAHHKTGKTSNLLQLPNSLMIDLEDSAGYFGGTYISVPREAKKAGIGPLTYLENLTKQLRKEEEFDYIIIDSLTKLEEFARPYATYMYKTEYTGADMEVKDIVIEGDWGLGYHFWREAFFKFLKPLMELANKTTILTSHIKDSSIDESGNLAVQDIDLSGKMKKIIARDVSATGFFTMGENPNERVISFKKAHNNDLITGTRVKHISNKTFVISEYDEKTGEITTHWDKIFKSLKK